MSKKLIPVYATKDDSGHWYVIPVNMKEEFDKLLEKSTSNKEGWETAETQFIDTFSQYMTGGDLNNAQLYAKI
jgi:hypothetical protein